MNGWEALILFSLMAALLVCAVASRAEVPARVPTAQLLVEPGDTLWSIARDNPAPGLSTAQTADLIAELNDLPPGELQAWSELAVPDLDAENAAVASR